MWVGRSPCAQDVLANADHHGGERAPLEDSRRAVAAILPPRATPTLTALSRWGILRPSPGELGMEPG
jgi:hypothetical protein